MSRFSYQLLRLREAKGLSPYRLAQLTGMTQQAMLNLEKPGADPKLSTLLKLANALGVSLDALSGLRSRERHENRGHSDYRAGKGATARCRGSSPHPSDAKMFDESHYLWPQRSAALLKELRALGFPDDAFQELHPKREHMDDYLGWLESKDRPFNRGSSNPLIQRRLEVVIEAYRGGRFTTSSPELWSALAKAAAMEVPIGSAAAVGI